ncbi:hypothetical protein [Oceanibaculum indicum]|uniref:EAL domain-containing protein n=1 Tax=Oceanibaculum indicum P24 TaxID=1207063 RepID=K2JJT6_9PROT|nr:hypothetical protein [Oceanibaculum indicum]EKE75593.1 hypothetical protein P24_10241 [Oceanibaculum indicum P24]
MPKSEFYQTVPEVTGEQGARKQSFYDSYSKQKLDPSDPAIFRNSLLDFVRSNKLVADALIAGNVQMLGFSEVRKSFGERWPSIKDKILLLAETVIKKHTGPADAFLMVNEEQIVILFGGGDKEKATRSSEKIAREINEKLSGVSGIKEGLVTCRALVLELDPKTPIEALTTPEGLSQTVDAAQKKEEDVERQHFEALRSELHVSYWPMANIRKKLISAYSASVILPIWKASGEEQTHTGVFNCELDCYMLTQAGEALMRVGRQRRALLIVPVHFDTLATKPLRQQFIAACQLLPRLSSKRILLEIVDLAEGVPQGRLHTLLSFVGPFFAGFVARQPLSFRTPERFVGLKMMAVAADGSHVGTPARDDVERMQGFAKACGKARMRSIFYGASTFEAATAARRCNYDYLQGAAVAPAVADPGRVYLLK